MMREPLRRLLVAAVALAGASCCARPEPQAFVKVAELGVFYGGQVEERGEIPFELDPGKQTQGFRVEFAEPLGTDIDVEWRIDVPKADPARKKKPRSAGEQAEPLRTTLSGRDVARKGETTLDHVLAFHPGDPLGVWNFRVVVRGKVVIDRPVDVFDPAARKRLVPRDAGGT
jgi:hypothetical protein